MITKADYITKRGASLRALDIVIRRLTDFADEATADVALNYYETIQELESTRNRAAKQLQALSTRRELAWASDDAVAGVEQEWRELRRAVLAAICVTYSEATDSYQ